MHTFSIWTTIAKVYIYLLPCFNISKQRNTAVDTLPRPGSWDCSGFQSSSTWKIGINRIFLWSWKAKKNKYYIHISDAQNQLSNRNLQLKVKKSITSCAY